MPPRRLLAYVDLILLVPAVFGLCALTWLGAPPAPGLIPAKLELVRYAVSAPETHDSDLARMAPIWDQLDPRPPEPEPTAPPVGPPSAPTVQGTLIALTPHGCIVQEPSGRQLALFVGDRWGDYEVTAITLAHADDVVSRLDLAAGARHQTLELPREE